MGLFGGLVNGIKAMFGGSAGKKSPDEVAREKQMIRDRQVAEAAAKDKARAKAERKAMNRRGGWHSKRARKDGVMTVSGWLSPFDVRCEHLMGMDLKVIRELWGPRAARWAVAGR